MRMLRNITLSIAIFVATVPVTVSDVPKERILANRSISLEKRYEDSYINEVFKDNILLTLAYLNNEVKQSGTIDWHNVKKPNYFEFVLPQGQTFAFHDETLSSYEGKVIKTTNAHFNSYEGFRSSGYLIGDGVCHLASLLYWAAKDAGLETSAPTNHDFAKIPEVPREYGVSIFVQKGVHGSTQNLYVTNNRNKPVKFIFDFDGHDLKITVKEIDSMRLLTYKRTF